MVLVKVATDIQILLHFQGLRSANPPLLTSISNSHSFVRWSNKRRKNKVDEARSSSVRTEMHHTKRSINWSQIKSFWRTKQQVLLNCSCSTSITHCSTHHPLSPSRESKVEWNAKEGSWILRKWKSCRNFRKCNVRRNPRNHTTSRLLKE